MTTEAKYKPFFKSFLKQHGFLPITHWHRFSLTHGSKDVFAENKKEIRLNVGSRSGLYIYEKNGKFLYVGKANPLFGRIQSHSRESFEVVPGDTKWNTWHKFFSLPKNRGRVNVCWKVVESEEERAILEKMLAYVLNPEFELFRRKIENR